MDIRTRKIKFVEEFLDIQSEEALTQFEELLKKEQAIEMEERFKPMTTAELNRRIDKSEEDFKNNHHKSTSELLAKFLL